MDKLSNIPTDISSAGNDCSSGRCWGNAPCEHHQLGYTQDRKGVTGRGRGAVDASGVPYWLLEARPVRCLRRKALTQSAHPSQESAWGQGKARLAWFLDSAFYPSRTKALTCGTGAKSSCGGPSWDGSRPGPGCRSVRRSARGAGAHRASPCGQQTATGSSLRGHSTAG